jgi:hypothetical protein
VNYLFSRKKDSILNGSIQKNKELNGKRRREKKRRRNKKPGWEPGKGNGLKNKLNVAVTWNRIYRRSGGAV